MKNHKVFWGSSYDRGILHLLKIWGDVLEKIPDAELHICYGWNLFEKAFNNNPERMAWKDKVDKLMLQDGIRHYGRIGKKELSEVRSSCGVWAYPVDFDEINCCSGDTPILMPRDHKKYPYGVPIKELVGKSNFYTFSFDIEENKIVLGKVLWVKKTRSNAELIKIVLDDGTELKFTLDHKFMLRNGEYIEARKLNIGDSLMPCYEKPTFNIRQTNGTWIPEHTFVAEKKFGDIKNMVVDHIDGNRFDNNPDNLELLTRSEHTHKIATKERVITDRVRNNMKAAQQKLSLTKERKDFFKRIGTLRANKFWDIFRSWPKDKQDEWLHNRVLKRNHSIISIEKLDIREDVYDMEVEKYHNFNAGGVFVHNCITALECQNNGLVPVVINKAALDETVQSGIKIDGDIYMRETLEQYKNSLIDLMTNNDKWEKESVKAKEFAKNYDWSLIADQWVRFF